MIFGRLGLNPEKIWHENVTDLSTSPVTILLNIMLFKKKTNCNPLAHPTWKCHGTNLWIAKLFHLTEDLLRSFKRWRLWKEPVVGCRRWLWKGPVMTCGNWNVTQAISQQVFRVTTFCVNTCFQFLRHCSVAQYTTMCWNSAHVATSRCRNLQHVHILERTPDAVLGLCG